MLALNRASRSPVDIIAPRSLRGARTRPQWSRTGGRSALPTPPEKPVPHVRPPRPRVPGSRADEVASRGRGHEDGGGPYRPPRLAVGLRWARASAASRAETRGSARATPSRVRSLPTKEVRMSRTSGLVEVRYSGKVEGFPGLPGVTSTARLGRVPPPTPTDRGKCPGQRSFGLR